MPFGFIAPNIFLIIWLSSLSKRVVSTRLGIYFLNYLALQSFETRREH